MPDRTARVDGVRTRELLVATLRRLAARGEHPTAAELAKASGQSPSNVRSHLPHLEQEHVIVYRDVPRNLVRREIILLQNDEQRPNEDG